MAVRRPHRCPRCRPCQGAAARGTARRHQRRPRRQVDPSALQARLAQSGIVGGRRRYIVLPARRARTMAPPASRRRGGVRAGMGLAAAASAASRERPRGPQDKRATSGGAARRQCAPLLAAPISPGFARRPSGVARDCGISGWGSGLSPRPRQRGRPRSAVRAIDAGSWSDPDQFSHGLLSCRTGELCWAGIGPEARDAGS